MWLSHNAVNTKNGNRPLVISRLLFALFKSTNNWIIYLSTVEQILYAIKRPRAIKVWRVNIVFIFFYSNVDDESTKLGENKARILQRLDPINKKNYKLGNMMEWGIGNTAACQLGWLVGTWDLDELEIIIIFFNCKADAGTFRNEAEMSNCQNHCKHLRRMLLAFARVCRRWYKTSIWMLFPHIFLVFISLFHSCKESIFNVRSCQFCTFFNFRLPVTM